MPPELRLPPKWWPWKSKIPSSIGGLILVGGAVAIYELATYTPGGPPVGPWTYIGDRFTKTKPGEWLTDQLAKILPP